MASPATATGTGIATATGTGEFDTELAARGAARGAAEIAETRSKTATTGLPSGAPSDTSIAFAISIGPYGIYGTDKDLVRACDLTHDSQSRKRQRVYTGCVYGFEHLMKKKKCDEPLPTPTLTQFQCPTELPE
jgi:hypothetical protein